VIPLEESLPDCDPDEAEDEAADEPREGESETESCTRIIDKYHARATTPLKAIRAFCISCMGGQVREVGRCTAPTCVLYGYRMGSKPKK
jgi:hypothetical protein